MQGEFSKDIDATLKRLIHCRLQVEAAIDFPDEDIDLIAESSVLQDCQALVDHIDALLQQAQQGAMLQEGITVVIAGRPNAGKSSLLNALSGEDAAIVTSLAGTTRDVLRQSIHIDGLPLHIVDTAGLRDSDDVIEQEGIKRAWQQIEQADLIVLLVDASNDASSALSETLESFHAIDAPVLIIKNKIDLTNEPAGKCRIGVHDAVAVSIKSGQGMEQVKQSIKQLVGYQSASEGTFIARRRHVDALMRACDAMRRGMSAYEAQQAVELFAEDLRLAQQALSEITGAFHSDDLLGEIFSSFCIGK